MYTAILLLGGKSIRFLDPETPKQFQPLSGKRVFLYALERLLEDSRFTQILLPCHPDWIEPLEQELQSLSPKIQLLEGGDTRQESVYKALQYLPKNTQKVLIHDGARPFLSQKMIDDLLSALETFPAAGTYIPSSDTIGVTDGEEILAIPKRDTLMRGQTPQAFHTATLIEAHKAALEAQILNATCDITLALRLNLPVKRVDGAETNIKITTPLDLYLAEQLIRFTQQPITKIDLENKQFALFGASGGIGHALQKALEEEGAKVIPLNRSSSPLSIDLNGLSKIPELCHQIHELYGPLDGCFFAAGILERAPLHLLSTEKAEEMIRVNFTSLIPLMQHLPLKPHAACILIASSSYYRGRSELAVYSATKAASVNLFQGLAEERPDLNIQIICPKRTNTTLRSQNFPNEDPALLLEPDQLAKTILSHLKSSPHSGEITNIVQ